ncbi:MAG: glutamate-cysteine ligase family protein [Verrucomicrobia bacterium]|nr:glutamate-cysteine ligase family protein [Verrucomicrobiota bacterium]
MTTVSSRLRLFQGIGVELEYMIVDAETLSVKPIADELIRSVAGEYVSDLDRGAVSWSNELVLHVIELKTNGPASSLDGLAAEFQSQVCEINQRLHPFGARLMPTAMHPWIDPHHESRLWPHEYSPVYEAYNRIFGCQGHGWSNLQSTHLNLPFATDEEFGRLHAAIRLVLPLLPALAASSPITDGQDSGWVDNRLAVYRTNSAKIPSITGRVIPEAVFSEAAYQEKILQPMYRDIAPFDTEEVLRDEFLNSRGAIARFSRGSIEIRVLDIQECPKADIAIASAVVETVRALTQERWTDGASQRALTTEYLESLFLDAARNGEEAVINEPGYLRLFGIQDVRRCLAGEFWEKILNEVLGESFGAGSIGEALRTITGGGTLGRRIIRSLRGDWSRDRMKEIYRRLCECLESGRLFEP